jgi:drug/metabolite transporter (DMT)-like permease
MFLLAFLQEGERVPHHTTVASRIGIADHEPGPQTRPQAILVHQMTYVQTWQLLGGAQVLALSASFMFGLALVLTQFGLRHASPGDGALVSIPTSACLFWLLAPLRDWQDGSLHGAAIFAGVGLLFPATVTLLTFEANRRMGPSVSGALSNLTPVFAILPATVLLGEVPNLLQATGVAAIVIGAVTLSINRRWYGVSWSHWALLLPIGIAAIRGMTHPVTKLGLALWPNPFAATLIGYTMSSIVVAIVARMRPGGWPSEYQRAGLVWFACVGICNGIGVLALYAALARGPVLLVSPLVATYPLVTLILTAIFLRTAGTGASVVIGVTMTVTGVIFLTTA